MSRFAKITEEMLDRCPPRLVGSLCRLMLTADFKSGEIPALRWSGLAGIMRCGERQARRTVSSLLKAGVISGNPPDKLRIDISAVTSVDTSDNTRIYQSLSDNNLSAAEAVASRFWREFTHGHKGKPLEGHPRRMRMLAEPISRSCVPADDLVAGARSVGERYASGGFPWPSTPQGYQRLVEQAEGAPVVKTQTNQEWLDE